MLRDVQVSDQTLMGASGGARSCIADLLKYYAAFLDADQDQASSGATASASSPFKQVMPVTSAQSEIPMSSFDNQAYCMGWVKGRLPGPLGFNSSNFRNLGPNVSDIGRGGPYMNTLNHAGSMARAMTGVTLFSESTSAIILLANPLALNDTADTVLQLVTEILFDLPEKHDFVDLTQQIFGVEVRPMERVRDQLEQERTFGTAPKDINNYVGTYQNFLRTMRVEILLIDKKRAMRLQGLEEETYAMEYYRYDTFMRWFSWDECARWGRFTNYGCEFYRIKFIEEAGAIHVLTWKTASQLPEPKVCMRLSD
ncbi:MAG: hypothetical protein LQ343_000152 [Gyalolechia ehrenbergii]|nr:MAG: hypothetical protein LQ343_000152 [Gyalolechia ehrenbergii]